MFPAHVVHAAGADDLVKCPDFPAVYYVGDDGARYVFPNENIYFSWYPDFSDTVNFWVHESALFCLRSAKIQLLSMLNRFSMVKKTSGSLSEM